eukprot:6323381-Amphidinium_carterae.5
MLTVDSLESVAQVLRGSILSENLPRPSTLALSQWDGAPEYDPKQLSQRFIYWRHRCESHLPRIYFALHTKFADEEGWMYSELVRGRVGFVDVSSVADRKFMLHQTSPHWLAWVEGHAANLMPDSWLEKCTDFLDYNG